MSAERVIYLDSSALVKLAVREPESQALRRYLARRRPLVCMVLGKTEVGTQPAPPGLVSRRGTERWRHSEVLYLAIQGHHDRGCEPRHQAARPRTVVLLD
jgi:hypothetical protein